MVFIIEVSQEDYAEAKEWLDLDGEEESDNNQILARVLERRTATAARLL